MQPLAGIKVLDFSRLLPGPLASLILAEAGAEVVKVERPGDGDELRRYEPRFGAAGVGFALLNRGHAASRSRSGGSPIETSGYARKLDLWRGQSSSKASL